MNWPFPITLEITNENVLLVVVFLLFMGILGIAITYLHRTGTLYKNIEDIFKKIK